ncbi:MAG: 1-acyl-sn-glycerol-3-phosphate acyltransferase [Holophagaceae bacterium]|nr:1-acyl-sn-glycerol-3-phosphate acyltransferase [Holophagaceae bacterium]
MTVIPFLWLLFWNVAKRKLVFTRIVRLSWCFFRKIMETLWLIKIQVSQKDILTLKSAASTIIVANHTSLIDIIILVSLTNDATCIVKGRLFQNPLIRFILANAFIGNDQDPIELIDHAVAALMSGYNLIIFPEGTRGNGEVKLRRGAAYIAMESLSDVLVLRIDADPPHLRKGRGWRDAGEKRVVYNIRVKAILKPQIILNTEKSRNINARMITKRIKEAFDETS